MTGICSNARGTEVDILCVILAIDGRRQQPYHVHFGEAAIFREVLHLLGLPQLLRHASRQLRHHVAQPMQLLLRRDVCDSATGVLDVLLPVHDLPDGLGLRTARIPDVDREHQRIAAWVIVEHRLHRRIGQDAAA
jgi:hypothetical protein